MEAAVEQDAEAAIEAIAGRVEELRHDVREEVHELRERVKEDVAALRERVDSTRRRFDEHESSLREMVKFLQSIALDVHKLRESKRALFWLAGVLLTVVTATGGALAFTAKWAAEHYVRDIYIRDSQSAHRSIEP